MINHWRDIIMIVSGIVIIALIMSTTCVRQDLNKAETNLKALTDTVNTYKLKNGELMYEKQGFIVEKKELEEYIGIKESEIKDIERKLNSALATIARLEGQVRIDTIHMVDSIFITADSTYINNFKYNDSWVTVDGTSCFKLDPFNSHTTINSISMVVPLKVGTTKDDKWFVSTDNPYVEFGTIEGANIDKAKPKRFSLGVQLGVGPSFGYGISGANDGIVRSGWYVGVGFYLGLGVSYKLIDF